MKCCAFEKIEDPKKKAVLNKINGIGFALFLVMIGGLLLVPEGALPESTWLIGLGLIMIGGSVARRLNEIGPCQCTVVMGVLLLIAGVVGLSGAEFPVFPILLIFIGVSIVIGIISKKKQQE
jgi:CHASE2 domain-containing sensor protein